MKYIITEEQLKILEQSHSREMKYQEAKPVIDTDTGKNTYPVFSCLEYEPINMGANGDKKKIYPQNLPRDVSYTWEKEEEETVGGTGVTVTRNIQIIFHKYKDNISRDYGPWFQLRGKIEVEGYCTKMFVTENLNNTFECGADFDFKAELKNNTVKFIEYNSETDVITEGVANDGTFENLPSTGTFSTLNSLGDLISKIKINTVGLTPE